MSRAKTVTAFVAAILICASASAQDWARERLDKSPRHLEWVKVSHDNRDVNCFVAYPEVKDKATAVIVIHEIFGLTDWVRTVTDQLAEQGYIAIAPDLLSGTGPMGTGSDEIIKSEGEKGATKYIGKLPDDQITADLNAVAKYVSSLPSCNGKLAVCGFCWGGKQCFRYATNNKELKSAFVFYGESPTDATSIARLQCPVYGFYAENDNRIDSTIPNTTKLMKDAGKVYETEIYKGAGHGFMRAGEQPSPGEANKKAREDAWQRWKDLLKKI
jgi:carboxymethylenebutenolidase